MTSEARSTRHWDWSKECVRMGHLHPILKLSVQPRQSGYDHDHTSTREDDLLILLNLPEHTQTWTRFDKRARTYRTTSPSGPSWDNVVARITIDDKTGRIMSLEYTKTHE